jgi:hypothetical protein
MKCSHLILGEGLEAQAWTIKFVATCVILGSSGVDHKICSNLCDPGDKLEPHNKSRFFFSRCCYLIIVVLSISNN